MDNLFLLILLPLISALMLAFLKTNAAKSIALILSLISLALTIPFLYAFDANGGMQFEQNWLWISSLHIHFHIGVT